MQCGFVNDLGERASVESSVLDTDIFSEVIKGVNRTVAGRASAYQAQEGRLAISVLTITEIIRGYHRMGLENHIARLLTQLLRLEVLSIDEISQNCLEDRCRLGKYRSVDRAHGPSDSGNRNSSWPCTRHRKWTALWPHPKPRLRTADRRLASTRLVRSPANSRHHYTS